MIVALEVGTVGLGCNTLRAPPASTLHRPCIDPPVLHMQVDGVVPVPRARTAAPLPLPLPLLLLLPLVLDDSRTLALARTLILRTLHVLPAPGVLASIFMVT